MNKTIDLENVEENNDSDDSSTIEIKPEKEKKPRKKAEYIFTEARQQAFEKARETRELRRNERKLQKQVDVDNQKKLLDQKIVKKAEIIKKKIAKKEKILDISDDDEPEIIIKKKPKKKIIVVESDSDDEIIIKKKSKPKPVIQQPQPPIKKYVPVYY